MVTFYRPPGLPEIDNPVDTTKERNVVHGATHDTRSNAAIAEDMRSNEPLASSVKSWEPEDNDLLGWDTTGIKEHHEAFERVYPGAKAALERAVNDGVTGRVKTLEAVVKKLKKKNVSGPFTEQNMEDIIGLRATMASPGEILAAAKVIKEQFKVTQDEDYITHPKDGYRSYHLTVDYKGKPVEIQVLLPYGWQHFGGGARGGR